jgi:hypothetical protein
LQARSGCQEIVGAASAYRPISTFLGRARLKSADRLIRKFQF